MSRSVEGEDGRRESHSASVLLLTHKERSAPLTISGMDSRKYLHTSTTCLNMPYSATHTMDASTA